MNELEFNKLTENKINTISMIVCSKPLKSYQLQLFLQNNFHENAYWLIDPQRENSNWHDEKKQIQQILPNLDAKNKHFENLNTKFKKFNGKRRLLISKETNTAKVNFMDKIS